MRASYRWLLQTLGMTAEQLPLNEVVERLTMAGIEVEAVADLGAGSGKIVAARVLEVAPHPNADKLSLCQVDTGEAEAKRIVCGAKNMGPGDMVPLALEGAVLPNGLVIKKSKIRGEASEGMMCSARELGWSEESSGLLILPPDDQAGSFYRKGETFDALLEIKVTPNRPDCLSIRGLARELRASLRAGSDNTSPASSGGSGPLVAVAERLEEGGPSASQAAQVRMEAPDACPRYLGRVIRGVKIGPSPLWLQRAVESAGLRSISNVVDVTNYILLESGHPLHAFDLNKVAGSTVIVRHAREGETAVTLDGQEVTLTATDLLIADPEKPIALAGIMGCGNSEITEATTDVFLECAYFTPSVIRRTSKRLGKSTDSSYRFERGVDWQALPEVVDRAAALIAQVAGGEVAPGVLTAGTGMEASPVVPLRVERVQSLLGISISEKEIEDALVALDFLIAPPAAAESPSVVLHVRVPAFRPDVTREADLIEEVARVVGYSRIPETLPSLTVPPSRLPSEERGAVRVREMLAASGFLEAVNYSFLSAATLEALGYGAGEGGRLIRLRNPLSAEYSTMRPSLVPGLLETALYNQNHGTPDVRLFEVGKVFRARQAGSELAAAAGPAEENLEFAALLTGAAGETTWRGPSRPADFYDMKAVAEAILAEFGLSTSEVEFRPPTEEELAGACHLYHPGKAAVAQLVAEMCRFSGQSGHAVLLTVGELHPALRTKIGLKRNTFILSGRLDALLPYLDRTTAVREIPAFPPVTRDLALVTDQQVPAAEIEAVISRRAKALLAGLRLFDVYQGERVPEGKKSLAYELRFSAPDRTLTDEEVNQTIEKVLADLKAKLGAELRA